MACGPESPNSCELQDPVRASDQPGSTMVDASLNPHGICYELVLLVPSPQVGKLKLGLRKRLVQDRER